MKTTVNADRSPIAEPDSRSSRTGKARLGRFVELDGIRGIAVIGVVAFHLAGHFDSKYPEGEHFPFTLEWGAYGVQLFFLVSGFVILMSAQKSGSAKAFVLSRFVRLYPTYWIALTVSILVSMLVVVPSVPTDWTTRLVNYTMFQRFALFENVDEVYWTLAVELQFYIVVAILLLIFRGKLSDTLVRNAGIAWSGLSLVTALLIRPYTLGVERQFVATPIKILQNLLLTEWAPFFVAGMFFYIARNGRMSWWFPCIAALNAVLVSGILHGIETAAWVAGVVTIFGVVAVRDHTGLLRISPLQWLGKVSYSIYLSHVVLGTAVLAALLPLIGRLPAMAITFVVVLAWSRVVHELGEIRASGWLRSRLIPRKPTASFEVQR